MGLKDILEKQIENFEDVFADIVNVLLLSDKDRKVNPDDLLDARARSIYTSSGEIREQERDNVKLWVSGRMVICLFGLENQTTIDRDMPVRVLGYEAGDYRLQTIKRRDEANAARKENDYDRAREIEETKLYPVVTLVLYYGTEKRWTGPRTLLECLDVPEDLASLVEDRHTHIVEVAWLTDKQEKKFTSDFRFLVEFYRQKRLTGTYRPSSEQAIKHVDTTLKLMRELTGNDFFLEAQNRLQEKVDKKEEITMMDVFSEARNEGRTEGIAIGEARGRNEERRVLTDKLIARGWNPQEAASFTGLTV